jgi:hypothetical protein
MLSRRVAGATPSSSKPTPDAPSAIACEIAATLAPRTSDGLRNKRWLPPVAGGYLLAFVLLTLTRSTGMASASPTASGPPAASRSPPSLPGSSGAARRPIDGAARRDRGHGGCPAQRLLLPTEPRHLVPARGGG